ncbi:MAG: hypothetical protein GKS07_00320 [Nitrosopumilus sp.]|nr:MAG: hypothetical protein GKS07_00320 [Nitrosopumilus sp.]
MFKVTREVNTVVLKKNVDGADAADIIDQKKTVPFKSLLSRPKKEDVHVHSLKLYYECILVVSGTYTADYFRKATHSISVDSNVSEISFGDGLFPVRSKSGIKKAFVGKRGKNKIDLKLEEHVFVEEDEELTFDHHGRNMKLPFKIDSKNVESYPKRVLKENNLNVKKLEITHDTAISKLESHLKKPLDSDVRELNDEFVLQDVVEVYMPVFEARLVGPKKKVAIIRIDAVRKKIL